MIPQRQHDGCPAPGLCLELKSDLDALKLTSSLRDSSTREIRAWLFSVVVLVLVQIGSLIWWASNLTRMVSEHDYRLADHEQRLRAEERQP